MIPSAKTKTKRRSKVAQSLSDPANRPQVEEAKPRKEKRKKVSKHELLLEYLKDKDWENAHPLLDEKDI